MAMDQTSYVSVDVLPLVFDRRVRTVLLGVHRREHRPYAGRLALPGVLLLRGERITAAAARALQKVGASAALTAQLVTFDEPNRDPRGPTLSVATYAVLPAPTAGARWFGFDEIPDLAFDHRRIVVDCRLILASMLWRDVAFTRALTSETFTATDALALHATLTGAAADRGNLNRTLASLPGLARTDHSLSPTGRGRPSAVWAWT